MVPGTGSKVATGGKMKRQRQASLAAFLKKPKAVSEAPIENEDDTEIISDDSDSEISHDPEAIDSLAGQGQKAASSSSSADDYHTSDDPSRDNQSPELG
jgi:hypothetical protein